jgi:hypothetical protein
MAIILDGTNGLQSYGVVDTGNLSVAGTTTLSNALPVTSGGTGSTSATGAMATLMGFTSTATAGTTTTLTNASSYYQLFTGTSNQTVQLPVTSTLATGWTFHICNNSTGTLTVNSSGSNLVISVPSTTTTMVTCIGTTLTTAADWEAGITDFSTVTGTGSVVLGTSPAITTATLSNPTITDYVETPYTATISAGAITLSLSNGTVQFITFGAASATITMPTAVSGKSFTLFLKQDSVGSRTATWTTVSWPSATAPTLTATANKLDKFVFTSNGTSWFGATAGQNYT